MPCICTGRVLLVIAQARQSRYLTQDLASALATTPERVHGPPELPGFGHLSPHASDRGLDSRADVTPEQVATVIETGIRGPRTVGTISNTAGVQSASEAPPQRRSNLSVAKCEWECVLALFAHASAAGMSAGWNHSCGLVRLPSGSGALALGRMLKSPARGRCSERPQDPLRFLVVRLL